jgi:hypothetical protein
MTRAGYVAARARCLIASTGSNPIAFAHAMSSTTSITFCPLSTGETYD